MNGMESKHRHTLAAPRVSGPTRPRVTTRQITHTRVPSRATPSSSLFRRLDVARVDRSRRARASRSSSSSTASASASRERTNTRMKIYTSRRRPALERVDVDRERTRAQRSDDPPTLDRRFARSTRRPEGPNRRSIGATRSRATRAMRETSMRTNRCERIDGIGSDRRVASARVRVSRMIARMTRANE